MSFAVSSLGAVGIAAIYLIYGAYTDHLQARKQREGVLRERVAYMLWNVASQIGGPRMETW
jgi:hypothetical protein